MTGPPIRPTRGVRGVNHPSNQLGEATSPYLRQHADNPVAWRQWNSEALAEAVRRDVPILLSIGYAACHWCHVMAHESFADDEVADVMNAAFVCIKVDREERPDLDAVYMSATVALTGQGGWPMTCFLTPDGRPFFCGTYYPKAEFLQLLAAVHDTWRNRRAEVEDASEAIAGELRSMAAGLPGGGPAPSPNSATGPSPACSTTRTPPAVDLDGRPSSRRRPYSRGCCEVTNAPVRPSRWPRSNARARRWRAAASTTSWAADSRATASTRRGWCRTSRRCSTTMRCCCGSTPTGPAGRVTRWRAKWPTKQRVSSSTRWAPTRCSPRRWTQTPTASRVRPTCGRPTNCAMPSGMTTDVGRRTFSV